MTPTSPTPAAHAPAAAQLLVIAKAPVPGRAKTRLSPPCTPEEAAGLAAAALADTLDAVRSILVRRRVVAFDGDPTLADLDGFAVLAQRGELLGARLACAFADAAEGSGAGLPTLLVGMDTPQLTGPLLAGALVTLIRDGAVYGPAADGGWWALGLSDPDDARVLTDVPMSLPDTGAQTLAALQTRAIRPTLLPELIDVDRIEDARAVAAAAPHTRFARALAAVADSGVGADADTAVDVAIA